MPIPIAARALMAFGDVPPSEEYEELVETGWWDLERIHPESCWYTIKASPPERLAHYRDRQPPCEYFECEGFNYMGYWLKCVGSRENWHEHEPEPSIFSGHDPLCGLEGEYCLLALHHRCGQCKAD